MVEEFNKKGIICDIYDTSGCKLIYDNFKSEKYFINKRFSSFLLNLPKINKYIKKYLHKRFYEKYKMKYDILTIHYIEIFYYEIIEIIRVFAKRAVVVAWGSDIYRVTAKDLNKISYIINRMDYLVAKRPMIEYLNNKNLKNKINIKTKQLLIVSKAVDNLNNLMYQETKEHAKERLDIPKGTFIMTFGYNARIAQQHEVFIKMLKEIRQKLPDNIFLLLQMTYGEDKKNYINDIDDKMKDVGLNYKIFKELLNDKDVLRIRMVSDITINIQTTDALSSSITEHLLANNVVIVGDWLPYEIFNEMGIYYLKTTLGNLDTTIISCLNQYGQHKLKAKINRDLIYEKFSFEKNIDEWVDFYKTTLEK